jgi:hypothetical protein
LGERESVIRSKDKIPKYNRIYAVYTQFSIPRSYLLLFESPRIIMLSRMCVNHSHVKLFFFICGFCKYMSRVRDTGYTREQRNGHAEKNIQEQGERGREREISTDREKKNGSLDVQRRG